jgi:hypothetical protein
MNLLDRYVGALGFFLPKSHSADIVREISEDIRSEAEDREAELGRPLNEAEQAAILARYGHPMLTAVRYRPHRYLVGPVVFPYYWLALKLLLVIATAGRVIALLVRLSQGAPAAELGAGVEDLVESLFAITAVVTAIAAASDYWLRRRRVLENWDPRDLARPSRHAEKAVSHALHAVGVAGRHAALAGRIERRFDERTSISGFVISLVLSAYFLLAVTFPYLLLGSAGASLLWGPAMDRLYPALIAMRATMLVSQLMWLMRPAGAPGLTVVRAARLVADALFVYLVLTADHTQWLTWLAAVDRRIPLNSIVATVLVWVAAFSAIDIIRRLWRWFGTSGPKNAPAATAVIFAICVGSIT